MVVPGLREACPALKIIVWGADSVVMDDLCWDAPAQDGSESEENRKLMAMDVYARMLFDGMPTLERLSIHDVGEDGHGEVLGEIYTRAEDKSMQGPDSGPIDLDAWSTGI